MRQFLGLMLMAVVLVSGCKSSQNAGDGTRRVGNRKVSYIIQEVKKREEHAPRTLSFKASTEVKTAEKNTSFKTSVRMVRDSVIWMSITAYSYEVARIIATPDSLKYVSRTEKKYYVGDYSFINQKLGVKFGFEDLQSLLLARSFGLDKPETVTKRNTRKNYVLSTLKQQQIERIQRGKEVEIEDGVEVLYTNWINPENFQVEKVSLLDVNTQNNASIQYLTFENISGFDILSAFNMHIIAKGDVEIHSELSRFHVNETLKFPFKISSKYAQIK
ncbi:DUF4292 domain-containing protein [bacterium SCSIO 12643]|nr:DUF4292 domain-containing protein [bacterium SCSIO 12643]